MKSKQSMMLEMTRIIIFLDLSGGLVPPITREKRRRAAACPAAAFPVALVLGL
jgi:hypothetical protein